MLRFLLSLPLFFLAFPALGDGIFGENPFYDDYNKVVEWNRNQGISQILRECEKGRTWNKLMNASYFNAGRQEAKMTSLLKTIGLSYRQASIRYNAEIVVMKELCPDVW